MTHQELLDFARLHADDDLQRLALDARKYPGIDIPRAIAQIDGRRRARLKLPTLAAEEGVEYPVHLSMEQCSSELTARYKASLCPAGGGAMADLTGGFGVDCYFIGQQFSRRTYIERNEELCRIARHNYRQLGFEADVVCADCTDYLQQMEPVDLIFIDPARRDAAGARTYALADCTPDITSLMPLLRQKCRRLLVKLSPMLDWRVLIPSETHPQPLPSERGDGFASEIHIVSVDNECKELLMVGPTPDASRGEGRLVCVNLRTNAEPQIFETTFTAAQQTTLPSRSGGVGGGLLGLGGEFPFLYEPNASLMKAGCFGELCSRFGVSPVGPNSHLFVSSEQVADFPGRSFHIERTTTMNRRELKAALDGISHANIATRNFPLSPAELRKRLKLKDGGNDYIFATTATGGIHLLFICRKIG
ncbi:MAG: SAM-dependent methyltransferase [Prevotella sp.]|nr:SAM-dependent methyltransferase [Prevotella sp.]